MDEVPPQLAPWSILDSLSDGLYVTDRERRIIYWNRAATEITGWPAAEILGRTCYDNILVHVDKDQHPLCGKEHCPLHRAIVTGTRSTVPSIVFARTRNGSRVPLQVTVAPVVDEQGATVGGVEVFRDLSAIWQDLQRAQRIQRDVLSCEIPEDPRVALSILSTPLDQVGGDFHRIERLDQDRIALMVADVVGHGVAAALYSVQLRTIWDDLRGLLAEPAAFLCEVNRKLLPLTQASSSFATCAFAILDLREMRLTFSSAAHCPILILRQDGSIQEVALRGLFLGFDPGAEYDQVEVPLHGGDLVLMYSDGAVEAGRRGALGQTLGCEGLGQLAARVRNPEGRLDLAVLERHLLELSGTIRLEDDLTLIQAHLARA